MKMGFKTAEFENVPDKIAYQCRLLPKPGIIIIIIIMSLFYEDDIFSKQCTNLTYGPL